MATICPLCNGMASLAIHCPVCNNLLEDQGKAEQNMDPYAPYDLNSSANCCTHQAGCPQCANQELLTLQL